MCLKNVIDLLAELVLDPFSKHAHSSKNGKVSLWRTCGVPPAHNTLLHPPPSGVLADEGPSAVTEATTDLGFTRISCTNHGGSYSTLPWSANRWRHMLGLADAVGHHGHGGLLEFNSSRVWMSHLSPAYNEGYPDMLTSAFVKKYDLNSWTYRRNFRWLFAFSN